MKLSWWSEDLPLAPATSSRVHIAHIFLIPQPKSGARDRCVTNILKSNASCLSYKPSFQAFFFFYSSPPPHGGRRCAKSVSLESSEKTGIIFTITVGGTVLAKWEVLEVARETLHTRESRESRPSTHPTWILVCLHDGILGFTLHDSRLHWVRVVRERSQRWYLGFGLEQLGQ